MTPQKSATHSDYRLGGDKLVLAKSETVQSSHRLRSYKQYLCQGGAGDRYEHDSGVSICNTITYVLTATEAEEFLTK